MYMLRVEYYPVIVETFKPVVRPIHFSILRSFPRFKNDNSPTTILQ